MTSKQIEVGKFYINKFGETIRVTGKKKAGWFHYEVHHATRVVSTPYMQIHARAIVEPLNRLEG